MIDKLELNTVYIDTEGNEIYIFDKGNDFYFGCPFAYVSKKVGERCIKLKLNEVRCYDVNDCSGVVEEAKVYFEGMLKVK